VLNSNTKIRLYKIDTITTDECIPFHSIPFRTMTTNTYTRILITLLCLQAAAAQHHLTHNDSQRIEYNRYYNHYCNYMGQYMCPAITSEEYKPKPAICTPTPPRIVSQFIRHHGNHHHPAYIISSVIDQVIEQSIRTLMNSVIKCIQYSSVIFSTTILLRILQIIVIAFLAYIMSIYE
jgi:hypothetical protein